MITQVRSEGKKITSLEGCEIEWREKNNFSPTNAACVEGSLFTINANLVIQAIGSFADDGVTGAKEMRGVFLGGDVADSRAATIAKAVGDGKKKAEEIMKFLFANQC